ncbi:MULTISPECIES: DUF4339 domain-containing protein [unclassified Pseudomonas]|uniref:DUF4339 domain-containing protein n=1 Tax=unclassified Pseudomonas TaxID=196821 RepID=UPI00204ED51F|nr:MAG TPA: GYF domain [Caudoviricetes sp.]|tara:strand:+ start:125 stop:631 length:507 start_codon:yes stop_codon:yes gene_type:complete
MTQVQWFYDDGGSRVGPITESDIRKLLTVKKIGHGTLVWKTGMESWVPIETTELKAELTVVPPPLSKNSVPNVWAWSLAFSPLLGFVDLGIDQSVGIFIGIVIVIALCGADSRKLHLAGHQPPSIWWCFIPPVYLYIRSSRLKANYIPMIVWIVCKASLFILPQFISM